jgi:glutathione peroxidase-family protein
MASIYDFKALTNRGKEIQMSDYKGQVILVVCGTSRNS